jgi:hypothetical protein
MAEFDDDRALRRGRGRNGKNDGRYPSQNQLAHKLSSQLTPKPLFWFFGLK